LSLKLDNNIFKIEFEKKHNTFHSSEIPDFYIYHKKYNKIIIGMNQLDLWSGGQQSNRGEKYMNKSFTDNCKILCVVCNHTEVKTNNNKKYDLFKIGFKNNTLCYIKNLSNIINEYFEL
jgi:hypothetical protein